MANMIIKPAADGNLLIQDRAGGAVLSTTASGATLNAPTVADMTNCTFPAGHIIGFVHDFSVEQNTLTSRAVIYEKAITLKSASSHVFIQVKTQMNINKIYYL